MYAVIVIIVMIIIVIIIIIIIQEKWCCATLGGPLTIHCTYLITTFPVTPSLSLAREVLVIAGRVRLQLVLFVQCLSQHVACMGTCGLAHA